MILVNFIKVNNIDEYKNTCKFCYQEVIRTCKFNCTKCQCKGFISEIHDDCLFKYLSGKDKYICQVYITKYKMSRYLSIKLFLERHKMKAEEFNRYNHMLKIKLRFNLNNDEILKAQKYIEEKANTSFCFWCFMLFFSLTVNYTLIKLSDWLIFHIFFHFFGISTFNYIVVNYNILPVINIYIYFLHFIRSGLKTFNFDMTINHLSLINFFYSLMILANISTYCILRYSILTIIEYLWF